MSKLALLVGINRYESDKFDDLYCCEADAEDMDKTLRRHWVPETAEKGRSNYATRTLSSKGKRRISIDYLRKEVKNLMSRSMGDGDVLFYFSGHGVANDEGGFLVTQDATAENPGYPMKELLEAANQSDNTSVVIILDCCNAGQIGNFTDGEGFNKVSIGPNVTVLAASGATQKSSEGSEEHSVFTQLVLEALDGGASDVRGDVSAASIYAYVEQSLGAWEQRPVYKSYARKLRRLRKCEPAVPDKVLAKLTEWFDHPEAEYQMDPTYEIEEDSHIDANVAIFDQFKLLRNANLLAIKDRNDLYWTALGSGHVYLTPQGKLFWKRAQRGDF